jgi:maltooligosyltrehalose trehalohydrolase
MLGERLSQLVSFEALKLAAGAVLLSPYIPLLFMGEEYAEMAPFLYFISHTDSQLVEAVRAGRKQEFADFHTLGEPPDADGLETFAKSTLNWELQRSGHNQILRSFYRRLIALRKALPSLRAPTREGTCIDSLNAKKLLMVYREYQDNQTLLILNFNTEAVTWAGVIPKGDWHLEVDSAAPQWSGHQPERAPTLQPDQPVALQPQSFVLYNHGRAVD